MPPRQQIVGIIQTTHCDVLHSVCHYYKETIFANLNFIVNKYILQQAQSDTHIILKKLSCHAND